MFSNDAVSKRVSADFVPVALKAGLVGTQVPGVEGKLYEEIARSRPAPQGIAILNSAGKVLEWALSFDDDAAVLAFLDEGAKRFKRSPGAEKPVKARRYQRFPSVRLEDMADGDDVDVPAAHPEGERCPAAPCRSRGSLVGRVTGRAMDAQGNPVADTLHQENYVEGDVVVSAEAQHDLASALKRADGKRFRIPDSFARALVGAAYLGMLDVNPLGGPGGENDDEDIDLWGCAKDGGIEIDGSSFASGSAGSKTGVDGRVWDNTVTLRWRGFAGVEDGRVTSLLAIAEGHEKLHWTNPDLADGSQPGVAHLPAGRPISLDADVKFGLEALPVNESDVAERPGDAQAMQAKIRKLHEGIRRMQDRGESPEEIGKIMEGFEPLVKAGKLIDAEKLLDRALEKLKP